MRVLHVVTDDDRRGAQLFAVDLHRALQRREVDSHIVALAAGDVGGLDVATLGSTRLGVRTLVALRGRLRRADVVVAHGSSTLAALAILSVTKRAPFVYRQISDPSYWWSGSRRRRVRWYLGRAAHVIALSAGTRRAVAGMGVPERCISVIANGVDPVRFTPASPARRQRARQSFGLDAERFTVGYVGALVSEKGVDVLVRACDALPDVQLLVVGDGPVRADLASLAAREGVCFAGSISDVERAYEAIDVLAFPSRAGDTMPAALIEAGMCGVAVVTTAVGAIGEMLEPGRTAVFVPVDDVAALTAAIEGLRDGSAERERLAAQWRSTARERYSIDAIADKWLEILTRVARRAL